MTIARPEIFHYLLDTPKSTFPDRIIQTYIAANQDNPNCVTEDDIRVVGDLGFSGINLGYMVKNLMSEDPAKDIFFTFNLIKSISNNRNVIHTFGDSIDEICRNIVAEVNSYKDKAIRHPTAEPVAIPPQIPFGELDLNLNVLAEFYSQPAAAAASDLGLTEEEMQFIEGLDLSDLPDLSMFPAGSPSAANAAASFTTKGPSRPL